MHLIRFYVPASVFLALLGPIILCSVGCQPNSLLRKRAVDALRESDFNGAEPFLTQAVEQDPTDWRAHFYLGKVRLQQERGLEAQLLLEGALALRPGARETPAILDDLAKALLQQHERDRLSEMLAQACRDYGTSYDFLRQGRFLARIDDLDGAVLGFEKAVRFSPEDPGPLLELADLFESVGDRLRAIDALTRAHRIRPSSTTIAQRLRDLGVVPGPTLAMPNSQSE